MCSVAINLGEFVKNWLQSQGGKIRKGMILIDAKAKPKSSYTFEAEIATVNEHDVTLNSNY